MQHIMCPPTVSPPTDLPFYLVITIVVILYLVLFTYFPPFFDHLKQASFHQSFWLLHPGLWPVPPCSIFTNARWGRRHILSCIKSRCGNSVPSTPLSINFFKLSPPRALLVVGIPPNAPKIFLISEAKWVSTGLTVDLSPHPVPLQKIPPFFLSGVRFTSAPAPIPPFFGGPGKFIQLVLPA